MNTISTIKRYLFLNIYGFLLIAIGGGILFFPLYKYSIWICLPQIFVSIICLKNGFGILQSWGDKKRKYQILISRNKEKFRKDTFSEFMMAPCGRLLTILVLKDLGYTEHYKDLRKAANKKRILALKNGCRSQQNSITYGDWKYQDKESEPTL